MVLKVISTYHPQESTSTAYTPSVKSYVIQKRNFKLDKTNDNQTDKYFIIQTSF